MPSGISEAVSRKGIPTRSVKAYAAIPKGIMVVVVKRCLIEVHGVSAPMAKEIMDICLRVLKPGFHMLLRSLRSYGNHSCNRCDRCDHMETSLAIVAIVVTAIVSIVAIIWKPGKRKQQKQARHVSLTTRHCLPRTLLRFFWKTFLEKAVYDRRPC